MIPASSSVLKHINILFIVLNLIAGTAVYLSTRQQAKKTRDPLLQRLSRYILSFNLLVAVDLGYQYFLTNVGSSVNSDPSILTGLMIAGVFAAEFGMTLTLVRLSAELKDRAVSAWADRLLWIWMALFAAATAFAMARFYTARSPAAFFWIHAAWLGSVILIIFASLLRLLGRTDSSPARLKGRRAFAGLFLAGYSGFALSNLDFYFLHWGLKTLDPLFLLFINLCPLIWLLRFYPAYRESASPAADGLPDRLAASYGISGREMDIIRLIIAGRSNREIEAALFISFSTVKNHIYNIFQKTGVKSRTQLIRLIRDLEKD